MIRYGSGRPIKPSKEQLEQYLEMDPVYKIVAGRNGKWYSCYITGDSRLVGYKSGLLHEYAVGFITGAKTELGIYCLPETPKYINRTGYGVNFPDTECIYGYQRKYGLCAILKCFPIDHKCSEPGFFMTSSVYVDSVIWQGHEYEEEVQ